MEDTPKPPLLKEGPGSEDKIFASLSYISILFVIPLILRRDDGFVYFHARQGMALFLAEIVIWFVLFMIESFLVAVASRGGLSLSAMLVNLAWLLFVALSLVGIYFVWAGKRWEMPIIGKIAKSLKV